jgi:hypothetical protein
MLLSSNGGIPPNTIFGFGGNESKKRPFPRAWEQHREDVQYTHGGGYGGAITKNAPQRKIQVTRSELQSKVKSKLDLFNVLTKEGQVYLPPFNECSMDFIKDLLCGKKKVNHSNLLTNCYSSSGTTRSR